MKGICRNISSFARQKGILNSFCTTVFQVLQKPHSGGVYERGAPRHLQGVVFVFFRHPRGIRFLYRLRFSAQCAKSGCRNFSEAFALTLYGSRKRFVRSGAAGFCATPCARGGNVSARCLYRSKAPSSLRVGLSKAAAVGRTKRRQQLQAHRHFYAEALVFARQSCGVCGTRASVKRRSNALRGEAVVKISSAWYNKHNEREEIWQNTMRRQ